MDIEILKEKKEELDAISPSFCLAKWKQATLHLHNGNTQSCHHVKSHVVKVENLENPAGLHNTPEKKQARSQMLSGKRPSECDYCWRIEDRGELSDRIHKSSSDWAWVHKKGVIKDGVGENTIPSYLEISFDSVCQFKCMYCSPAYSTKWQAEIEEFGPYPTLMRFNGLGFFEKEGLLLRSPADREKYIQAFWKWWPQISSKLEHLRVTGGEPFLSKETFRLIDELIAKPQPHLIFSINTNMGFNQGQLDDFVARVANLQKSVAKVIVFTSLDTVGKQAEYIRFGLNYSRFKSNLDRILSETQMPIQISFMITVNNLSLPGMPGLMEYIRDLRLKYPMHEISLDTPYLRNPQHMSVEILPKSFIQYIEITVDYMQGVPPGPGSFTESEIQKVSRIRELM
ncbi:MAG: twitch domain-containing radical SAM protein, partial [Pseudobdellovibrionaceae bacterium]